MTYWRLEEYLLRQNYGLLCEMLCYQLILYKEILWCEASFTFQIKSKDVCVKHCNQLHQVNFIHFLIIPEERQRWKKGPSDICFVNWFVKKTFFHN